MKILSTKTHGYLDYVAGAVLIISPWLFGFAQGGPESWLCVTFGGGNILFSLATDYETGWSKIFSVKTHLILDFMVGAFLAASPWIFGFIDIVFLPHLLIGCFFVVASFITRTTPEDKVHYEAYRQNN